MLVVLSFFRQKLLKESHAAAMVRPLADNGVLYSATPYGLGAEGSVTRSSGLAAIQGCVVLITKPTRSVTRLGWVACIFSTYAFLVSLSLVRSYFVAQFPRNVEYSNSFTLGARFVDGFNDTILCTLLAVIL